MLLDSNILIYAAKETTDSPVHKYSGNPEAAISAITKLEVLGFHGFEGNDKTVQEIILANIPVYTISEAIIDQAIALRQQKSMSLGDAIIAATTLKNDLTLITRNTGDFAWIDQLEVVDPFDE